MKAPKDSLDVLSILGMIGASLLFISGFIGYIAYRFGNETPKDGIEAVFAIGSGFVLWVFGQFGWYGRRLMRLEREVETLRGTQRPE